jgi:hypothetical protein
MSNLMRNLDTVFEHRDDLHLDLSKKAIKLTSELLETKQKLNLLQKEAQRFKTELIGALALAVRRKKSGLNVGVNENECKIGYKTVHLSFVPDIENQQWIVESTNKRFAATFASNADLTLNGQLTPLVEGIVQYFSSHVDKITGIGLVVVENKLSTLMHLVEWYKNKQHRSRLNSRKYRNSVR